MKGKKVFISISIVLIVIVMVIAAIVFLKRNKKSSVSSNTVNMNQVLEINEYGDKVTFKVEQIDKPIYEKGILDDEEKAYTGIKITAKNLNSNEVSIANYDFSIFDSKDNEIDLQLPGLSRIICKSNR